MNVREIIHADCDRYRQLRTTLDNESPMWGAVAGEREHLGDHAARQFDQLLQILQALYLLQKNKPLLLVSWLWIPVFGRVCRAPPR